jgi:hypothetical protein
VIGLSPNSYAIGIPIPIPYRNYYQFLLAGQRHRFEFPVGVIRPEQKDTGNVVGCGILMDPDDKFTIFFTVNGILIGPVLIFSFLYIYNIFWLYFWRGVPYAKLSFLML